MKDAKDQREKAFKEMEHMAKLKEVADKALADAVAKKQAALAKVE